MEFNPMLGLNGRAADSFYTRHPSEIRYLLANIPVTDPTSPYHSISYLVGAASAAGFTNHKCIDCNIDALNYLAEQGRVCELLNEARSIREDLERRKNLTRREQLLYRYSLKAVGLTADSVTTAIEILRTEALFYNFPTYRQAAMVLQRWGELLSIRGWPGQFDGLYPCDTTVANLNDVADLTRADFINQFVAPYLPYFEGPFREILSRDHFDLIGLSVNYSIQLPFAVWMCRFIRSYQPNALLCVGGTEIATLVKCIENRHLFWTLFSGCDAAVIGEGETALCELLASASCRKQIPRIRGVWTSEMPELPRVQYEDLSRLPSPRYDIWDWQRYWSPSPVILYSPTRGCYWNKCTFCDYGLNTDAPTSPSRERPINLLQKDLEHVSSIGHTMLLAVDAISPTYLQKLCNVLEFVDNPIRWSCEIRLEKALTKRAMGAILKRAGCVCVAFGYESGCQRVLGLIDKGVDVEVLPSILAEMYSHDIGVQLMGFVGFPTETDEEALQTFDVLNRNSSLWSLAGIGEFMLTPGAIVAKNAAAFGISELSGYFGDDIIRTMWWREADGRIRIPGTGLNPVTRNQMAAIRRLPDDRPFVGGIGAGHSLLYFARYGHRLVPPEDRCSEPANRLVESEIYSTSFGRIDEFASRERLEAVHLELRKAGRRAGFNELRVWLDAGSVNRDAQHVSIEVFPNGSFTIADLSSACSDSAFTKIRNLILRDAGLR